MKMKILVDADACPVKEIIVREAKKRKIDVVMVNDTSHSTNDGYSRVVTVDKGKDSADIKLVNLARAGDIVVTQDYGVGAMVIAKGAKAVNQNGWIYSDENMDQLLFERYINGKQRKSGLKTVNSKKRTKEDDRNFEKTLKNLLDID